MSLLRTSALLLALSACAEMGLSTEVDDAYDGATDADALLRVDVFPPADLELRDGMGNLLTLRPQTFYVDAEPDRRSELVLTPAIGLTGRVVGEALTPWATQSLPTVLRELAGAEIGFNLPGTIQQPRATTSSDGLFDLWIVPDTQDYELTIVPATPDVPFLRRRVLVAGDQRELDISIAAGAPIWGFVRDAEGRPLIGAKVRAVDTGGLAGPIVETDGNGRYLLTVEPGAAYTLTSLGRGALDPTVRIDTDFVEAIGQRVDIPYGDIEPRGTISGSVRGASGAPVVTEGIRVRVVATELRSAPGSRASYSREIGLDDGIFAAVVPPGTYRVEIFSRQPEGPAPVTIEGVRTTGQVTDTGATTLQPLTARFGELVDPSGAPVGGAVVSCTEIGFGARTFTTTADPIGQFVLTSPEVPLACTLSPPAARNDLATTRITLQAERFDDLDTPWIFELPEGVVVSGSIAARLAPRLDEVRIREIAGALVEVRDSNRRLLGAGVSGADGRFVLRVAR